MSSAALLSEWPTRVPLDWGEGVSWEGLDCAGRCEEVGKEERKEGGGEGDVRGYGNTCVRL
mgnify:CR=1 FL=1